MFAFIFLALSFMTASPAREMEQRRAPIDNECRCIGIERERTADIVVQRTRSSRPQRSGF